MNCLQNSMLVLGVSWCMAKSTEYKADAWQEEDRVADIYYFWFGSLFDVVGKEGPGPIPRHYCISTSSPLTTLGTSNYHYHYFLHVYIEILTLMSLTGTIFFMDVVTSSSSKRWIYSPVFYELGWPVILLQNLGFRQIFLYIWQNFDFCKKVKFREMEILRNWFRCILAWPFPPGKCVFSFSLLPVFHFISLSIFSFPSKKTSPV